jgi:O-antigen/teichoic acid export membrane protein
VVTFSVQPLKAFNDVLRGTQRFVFSAVAEITAYVVVAGLLIALALGGAPLWLLVTAGAMPQLLIGGGSAAIVISMRLPYRFRRRAVTLSKLREFLGVSSYLSLIGLSVLVIYALDRTILGAFRSAATVGLYEGPVRVHNLVQQVHATFAAPVLPASSRFASANDLQRLHDLLLRGTRYTLAGVVPISITFMALARPILNVWLGPRFGVAATALTLLVGYWLVNANTGIAGGMLLAVGQVRQLTAYAGVVALVNICLSLALTPSLGLNGVVLGTAISYVVAFPFFLALTLRALPITLRELIRTAWLPAYLTGAVLALMLVVVRITLPLNRLSEVLATALLALAAYWSIYFAVWLGPNERLLVRSVVLAIVKR